MTEILLHIELLLIPLVISNTVHMMIVKAGLFRALDIPIWETGFGRNKTWRGFIVLIALNALFELLCIKIIHSSMEQPLLIGGLLGFTYLLSELPNSYLKRRLGIRPGGRAEKNKYLFILIDKTDSAMGVSLVYGWIMELPFDMVMTLFLINSLVHFLISYILVSLKIKSGF